MNPAEIMDAIIHLTTTPVLSRDGTEKGYCTGGSRRCRMEGCGGKQIGVRWEDGKLTWPCSKGMTWDDDKQSWQIG